MLKHILKSRSLVLRGARGAQKRILSIYYGRFCMF